MVKFDFITLDQPQQPGWDEVNELFRQMYAAMDAMGLMIPLAEDGAENWVQSAKNIAGKYGITILVKNDAKAIGFAHGTLRFMPDYLGGLYIGSITHVYVDEQYRRTGIGKLLIKQLEDWFLSKKVHSIELQVIAGNQGAQSFWQKLGYHNELVQYRKMMST